MSNNTVNQLADVLKMDVKQLLSHLKAAKLMITDPEQIINAAEKLQLLEYLKNENSGTNANATTPKKITLQRKSVSEMKVKGSQGRSIKVSVQKSKKLILVDSGAGKMEEEAKLAAELAQKQREQEELERQITAEAEAKKLAEAPAVAQPTTKVEASQTIDVTTTPPKQVANQSAVSEKSKQVNGAEKTSPEATTAESLRAAAERANKANVAPENKQEEADKKNKATRT